MASRYKHKYRDATKERHRGEIGNIVKQQKRHLGAIINIVQVRKSFTPILKAIENKVS
jgi:hypothetical protein